MSLVACVGRMKLRAYLQRKHSTNVHDLDPFTTVDTYFLCSERNWIDEAFRNCCVQQFSLHLFIALRLTRKPTSSDCYNQLGSVCVQFVRNINWFRKCFSIAEGGVFLVHFCSLCKSDLQLTNHQLEASKQAFIMLFFDVINSEMRF